MIERQNIQYENVVIIGIINENQNADKTQEFLDELSFLAFTAGGQVLKRFTQKLKIPNSKTFLGAGKIEEVKIFVKKNEISTVIFDEELSPAQQGKIEQILRCKIIDRTGLILDIFAQRAKTSYARTQVELAQYQYLSDKRIMDSFRTPKRRYRTEDLEKLKLKQIGELFVTRFHY